MCDRFTNFGSMLNDPLSGFGIVVKLALDISSGCCGDANLIELGIYLNILASTRSKRGHNSKYGPTGFHSLAIAVVAEHTSASYLTVKCISVNRHMQICAKCIGLGALLLHGLHMTELHFNTTANERLTTSLSNLSALLGLGSIAICISIVSLIRRGQINFVGHL